MYRIHVTFGHTNRDGISLAPNRVAAAEQRILETFAELFGGGHIRHEFGSYQTRSGRTILERCTIASAETNMLGKGAEILEAVASRLAEELEQETVLVTITRLEGVVLWVKPLLTRKGGDDESLTNTSEEDWSIGA
jgi:hypothetical protein